MRTKKVMRTIALAVALVFMFSTAAMAAIPEFTIIFGDKAYNQQLLDDESMVSEILGAFKANDNTYAYKDGAGDITDPYEKPIDPSTLPEVTYKDAEGNEKTFAAGDGDEIIDSTELAVVSVSAITTKIENKADQELKYELYDANGKVIAELPEGYTIEFLFNLDVDANALERTTGKVDASLTGTFNVEEFKYAVKVTPAEGDAITSEWTTVKVVDANKPVEVTEYGLDFDLDYITMTDAGVEIKATKALNGLGKEVTAPAVEKVTSSDITTAYYDDGIVPLKAGTVTFTVKFEDIEETYPLTVEIKEAQKPSAIKADDVIVKFGDSYTMEVELLDQYGELFRGTKDDAEGLVIHLLSDDKVINKEFGFEKPTGEGWPDDHPTLELNNGIISTSAPMSIDFEGAPITATLKLGDKVLGSFKIEIVKIEEDTKPDQYKLTFNDPKKTELDVNPIDNEALKELKIDVEAYVKGARVDTPSTGLIAKTSNKKVVDFKSEYSGGNTITVEAVAEGTATITLYTKEGDLETKVADIEVVVKNTTPQIDTLTVKPVAGENKGKLVVVEGADVNVNAIAGQLTTGDAELDTKLATDIIDADSFVYSEADGKLIVTLKDEFGGKSFVFDIVITPAGEGA